MTDHGAGDDTVDNLKKEIQTFKDVIKPSPVTQVPVGIGFLAWYLDAGHKDLLVAALDLQVKAVFFAFGDHIDHWINFVRSCNQVSRLSLTRTPQVSWNFLFLATGQRVGDHHICRGPLR
jgi:hypothetical protein